jgi:hypothetical protein
VLLKYAYYIGVHKKVKDFGFSSSKYLNKRQVFPATKEFRFFKPNRRQESYN